MFEDKIAERISDWMRGERSGPFEVQFNPTNRCNLKCRFCWLRDFDGDGLNYNEISMEKYKEMVKDCSEMGVHNIEVTGGGEPLMRRDVIVLMKAIKDYDIFGRLITNGTLLTEKMIKILVKIGWDEIVFSLDAPDKKINDYLRGKSFDRIVRAIKTLQIEKNRAKSDKPMVNIHMVLCNKNYHVLPEMFEFAYDLNCRNLLVEPIVLLAAKTKAGKELLFGEKDREAVLKYIQEATRVAHDRNFQTNVDKLGFELIESTANMKGVIETEGKEEKNPWLSMPCFQPFYHMIVRPWGTVGPCCMFDNIGEDVNKKSLRDIWFGKFFEDMRKRALEKNMPDFCSKCNPSQIQENRKIRAFLKAL